MPCLHYTNTSEEGIQVYTSELGSTEEGEGGGGDRRRDCGVESGDLVSGGGTKWPKSDGLGLGVCLAPKPMAGRLREAFILGLF
jgi:hypothetical protein